jgi:hypothetical protein
MAKERSCWSVCFVRKTTKTAVSREEGDRRNEVDLHADSSSAGTNISSVDPEEERRPPERPTRVVLPQVETPPAVRWSDAHPPPDFQQLFASIQRHEAVLTGHLKALNCHQQASSLPEALLPPRDDGTSYFAPTADTEKNFGDRIAEIDITTDAAFRSLSKTTKSGETAPRLAHMRKFWLSLDNMSEYWDTSMDQYYSREIPVRPIPSKCNVILQSKEFYKGRRTGPANEMPDTWRAETVRAFVEGVTSAFNCRVSQPYVAPGRVAPVIQINKLEQPIRLSGLVMRLPADQNKARSGILEGPVIGIFESNCIDFISTEAAAKNRSEHHLLREIAALLFLAQQRRREGQTATTPGEGEWYTTEPRWGGGAGHRLSKLEEAEAEHRKILARLTKIKPESLTTSQRNEEREARRELKIQQVTAKRWAAVKGAAGLWDSRTEYKAVGRSPGSPYDEVRKLPASARYPDYKANKSRRYSSSPASSTTSASSNSPSTMRTRTILQLASSRVKLYLWRKTGVSLDWNARTGSIFSIRNRGYRLSGVFGALWSM